MVMLSLFVTLANATPVDSELVKQFNAHLFKRKGDDFCWKKSFGRGVGSPINTCPDGDKNGALCYTPCSEGYYGAGPVCWEGCADGYHDDGAFCRRPWPLSIYAKKSYGRGAGEPLKCSADKQYDAGLCYPSCGDGFAGVGPVCWGECRGDFPTPCGAGCATSDTACKQSLLHQITSIPEMAFNIGMIAASAGGVAVAGNMLRVAATEAEKAAAQAAVKAALISSGKALTEASATQLAERVVFAAGAGTDINWATIEPSGIAAVVYAFKKPQC